MKNIILFLLIFSLYSCKKDNSQTTSAPTNSLQTGTNQITFKNCKFTNKVLSGNWSSQSWANISQIISNQSNIRIMFTQDTLLPNLLITTRLTGIGTDSLNSSVHANATFELPSRYYCLPSSTVAYWTYNQNNYVSLNGNFLQITRFDAVGGLVEGNYKLKMLKPIDNDTLTATGVFSIQRR